MPGRSVVQNGALSASLKRLSLVARDQLSSPSLSSALSHVNLQGAPAHQPQREGLCPAPVHVGRLLEELGRARLQDLHAPAGVETWTVPFTNRA
jgi:hypothetical protein